jgi:hypothetical protein
MAQKELQVIVEPDGTVTIEAIGYTGPLCEQAVRELEEFLGGKTIESKKKPEWFRNQKKQVQQR